MRIDAHQHFWQYDPVIYDWIDEEMSVLRKDFYPANVEALLKENNFDGCVAVQSEQTQEHNEFLFDLAEKNDFIKAVVGWVDLRAVDIEKKIGALAGIGKLKGFRHILQGEQKPDLMLDPSFTRGLKVAGNKGYTYDILIYASQLKYVEQLLQQCPGQKFILDHLGKPPVKTGEIKDWESTIVELASYDNLYCKMSGLVTEAAWNNWKYEDFIPYMEVVTESFDTDRIIFGSDWPVCTLAAKFEEVVNIVKKYYSAFTASEQKKIFGLNAVHFYNLQT